MVCAEKIISTLARRAYRGFIIDTDVQDLLGLYTTGRQSGEFEAGIELALRGILASPKFAFRFEFDPAGVEPGAAYRISDLELASRLSFFLWSSIPDGQLLDVAARGDLRNPAVLERQVRRMLADSRANALVDNFAGSGFTCEILSTSRRIRRSFRTSITISGRPSVVRQSCSLRASCRRSHVLDLLNADYTFVNERLARHYGIPKVVRKPFQAGRRHRREPARAPRPRQHADGHVVR